MVFVTQPSKGGETLHDVAREQGCSPLVLSTYNPHLHPTQPLPEHTCVLTWAHSHHNASCMEIVQQHSNGRCVPLVLSNNVLAMVLTHVANLHRAIHSTAVRFASHTLFTPDHAQSFLTTPPLSTPPSFSTITLPKQCTMCELYNDPHLQIDWEAVAKHPQLYPAVFKNSRGTEYTFLFEKFMQNGNCKGKQMSQTHNKTTCYVNSAGLPMDQLCFKEGATLPCRLTTPCLPCVSSYEETIMDIGVSSTTPSCSMDSMERFHCMYDSRELFVVPSCASGCALVAHTAPPQPREEGKMMHVGIATTVHGHTCYTLFSRLSQIVLCV